MAVPLEKFVKQLEDSGIIAGDTLKDYIPPKANPKDAEDLALELIRHKKLTKFQVEEISRGKGPSLVLGNYVLMEKVGAGGMGQVFKAEHRRMHRIVAIKVLPPNMTKDEAAISRFEREVTAAAKISHPNIVSAYDADCASGVHFLVMEFVEGSDLSALVRKNGPVPVDKAVNYVLQVARGLEAAHHEGIVHRDIKPANLLLDKKGTIKILDMGLARLHATGDGPQQTDLTNTGSIMGTVDYMSPEQALDTKTADARADIYALGCTLHYLLLGKATYEGDTLIKKVLAHREQPIPLLRAVRPEIPEQLGTVFRKMVAKKVEDRYQTVTEAIAALEGCGRSQEQTVRTQQLFDSSADSAVSIQQGQTAVLKYLSLPPTIAVRSETIVSPPTSRSRKKPLWIGAGIVGIAMLAVIIVSLRTKDGTLLVEVDQSDAIVQVLDTEGKVEVSQKGGKGTVSISVDPGKHRLKVQKDGFTVFGQEFEMKSRGKTEITATLKPQPVVAARKPLGFETPGFDEWIKEVATMPAEQQVEAVAAKLKELNPWFDGKLTPGFDGAPGIQNGVVTRLTFVTDYVSDISPLRALKGLRQLRMDGSSVGSGKVSDLSPLKGMQLDSLSCHDNQISDLSPLQGMPLALLGLSRTKTVDLSPLKGMPLTYLDASGTAITDLSPLRGMPLEALQLTGTQVTDLSPLEGMKLTYLGCGYTRIVDLTPLKGVRLETLDISYTELADLSALKGMPLKSLACSVTKVADLSPLKGMSLEGLSADHTPINDLSPIQGMPLKELQIGRTAVSDLSPLEGMSLAWITFAPRNITNGMDILRQMKSLQAIGSFGGERIRPDEFWKQYDAGEFTRITAMNDPGFQQYIKMVAALPAEQQLQNVTASLKFRNLWFDGKVTPTIENGVVTGLEFLTDNVTDISPLSALTGLKVLRCRGSGPYKGKLADLSPLKDLKLDTLDLTQTNVSDLSPLKGMPLTFLAFSDTPVSDLSPLQGMPLVQLAFWGTKVSDLSPLKGMPLIVLGLGSTPVTDLSPLQGMQLTTLMFPGTKVADLSPLRGMPLTYLQIGMCPYTDISPLKGMPLVWLDIQQTQVADLTPLKGMPLTNLTLQWTNVSDLSPLQGMLLEALVCGNIKVSDFSLLKEMPLKVLAFDFKPDRDTELLRSIKTLQEINFKPAAEFWKRFDAGEFDKPDAVDDK